MTANPFTSLLFVIPARPESSSMQIPDELRLQESQFMLIL